MPTSIFDLSDDKIIKAHKKLNQLATIQEKLDFMYATTGGVNIDVLNIITINDQKYEWGIKLFSESDYIERNEWFFNKMRLILSEEMKSDLDNRLKAKTSIEEKNELLVKEKEDLMAKAKVAWVKVGYDAALTGKSVDTRKLITVHPILNSEKPIGTLVSTKAIFDCTHGMAYYDLKIYSQQLLAILNNKIMEQQESVVEIPEIEFKNISNRLVFLKELGIINHLSEQYGQFEHTKLASIIAALMNVTGKKEIGSIRRTLSHLINDTEGTPVNKKSTAIVKAELAKLGIKLRILTDTSE